MYLIFEVNFNRQDEACVSRLLHFVWRILAHWNEEYICNLREATFSTRWLTKLKDGFRLIWLYKMQHNYPHPIPLQGCSAEHRQSKPLLYISNSLTILAQRSGEDEYKNVCKYCPCSESLSVCHYMYWATKPAAPFSWDLINSYFHCLHRHKNGGLN